MKLSQNPWKRWGFKGNPFETSALSLNSKNLPLIQAFVGRSLNALESKQIIDIISNPGGGRAIVEGDIGVGKTTLINYHRYLWENESEDLILTPIREISIYQKWEAKDFLMDIIGHLSNKLLFLIKQNQIKKNKLFDKVRFLHEIFYRDNIDIQGNLFGIGIGYNKNTQISIPEMSESQLISYLMDIVEEIKKIGYKGVFLHFDNLELLIQNEIKKCQGFFEEIRDILQLPDIYYVFVAKSGFFSQVIAPLERLNSIMSWPIHVEPLTCQEVLDAVNVRYELLSCEKKYTKPVEDEFIEFLYHFYKGKIRFVMDSLARVILSKRKTETLSIASAQKQMHEIIKEKTNNLTSKEFEILLTAINMGNFSNVDLVKQLNMKASNISRALTKFQQRTLIHLVKKKSTKQYYACQEELKILANKKIQCVSNKKQKRQVKMLKYIEKNRPISRQEYMKIADISEATARRDLQELTKSNKIEKIVDGKNYLYKAK